VPEEEIGAVNKVLLTGRLTRDPELRSLASGSSVATFAVATNEFRGNGKERAEFHNVVVWDRLAQVCGQYLGKGQQVAIEGRLQTRQWDDDRGTRHWKTEVVATSVEMLSGRRKRDYEADSQAAQAGDEPVNDNAISPNEAAEVGVITAADASTEETVSEDDDQVLVLA
jgi:single-strand DNA-binding protein